MSRRMQGGSSVPRQAPAAPVALTGRDEDLAWLRCLLPTARQDEDPASIAVISGTAGVGKTALANYWAHKFERAFPDGTLYTNLRGFDARSPVEPRDVLTNFLRAMDVPPGKIPTDVEALSALYRSVVAELQLLIVLDNASSADQVRPLLPGQGNCRVLVTSRNRLSSLVVREGASRLSLNLLDQHHSESLLRSIIGEARASEARDAVSIIAKICSGLPLTLRIAGEIVVRFSETSLNDLAIELSEERGRLDFFDGDDESVAVRSVFSWSYRALKPEVSRLFRVLGLHPTGDFGVPVASALANVTETRCRRLLDSLAGAHLVESHSAGRYRFHDLLHDYAAECAEVDEIVEARNSAKKRMIEFYLYTAAEADRIFVPDLPPIVPLVPIGVRERFEGSRLLALEWSEAERANVVSIVRLAATDGFRMMAWQLALVPWGFYELRKHWADWIKTHEIGLLSARECDEQLAEAMILNSLGIAYRDLRRFEEALGCFEDSLAIRTEIGDEHGQALNLNSIGITMRELGRYDDAIRYGEQSLDIRRRIQFRWGEAHCLADLGIANLALHDFDRATSLLEEALGIWRAIGAQQGEAMTLVRLGEAYFAIGDIDGSLRWSGEAVDLANEIGSRIDEAAGLYYSARAYRALSNLEPALQALEISLEIRRSLGHYYGELQGLVELGRLLIAMRKYRDARTALDAARSLSARINDSDIAIQLDEVQRELASSER